jgi:hypothetical protein
MLEEIMNARQSDLRVAAKTIEHRITWEQMFRIERLERALSAAKGRLQFLPGVPAKVN